MYKRIFKPTLDFLIALIGLLVLSPIFLFVMIALTIVNNGKPFFFQKRPGKNEKIFSIIKFKTMTDEKDEEGKLLPDSKRLTNVGRIIRKTSLDEIPQLLNVLKGDMSLIGPRPLLIKYLPYYSQNERKRHLVRPGITGLAQVKGRNTLDWDTRLAYDVYYVENLNFITDIRILWRTISNVITSRDLIVDPELVMKNLDEERKNNF